MEEENESVIAPLAPAGLSAELLAAFDVPPAVPGTVALDGIAWLTVVEEADTASIANSPDRVLL